METLTVTGTVQWFALGAGAWGLVTDGGQTYELFAEHNFSWQEGMTVCIIGHIRDDIFTTAAIGPTLKVISWHQVEGAQ